MQGRQAAARLRPGSRIESGMTNGAGSSAVAGLPLSRDRRDRGREGDRPLSGATAFPPP